MADMEDLINRAGEAIVELRRLLSEGNSMIKEMRKVEKSIDVKMASFPQIIDAKINADIEEGLKNYNEALQRAIADAEKVVNQRFDRLATILLGEDAKSRRLGQKSLEQYANEIAQAAKKTNPW